MIHDEICTFEVCKLAKEKGFPVKEIECWYCEYDGRPTKEIVDEQQYPIISQSLLQRWLREEKALHIQITLWEKGWYNDIWAFEYYEEEKEYSARQIHQSTDFDTYELALEDALKYALENLI